MQRWEHLLDGLSTLQALEVRTSFSGFLALLAREANRPGEAHNHATPALQVLTPEEAKDQLFDLGIILDETCLKSRDAPDPFIPLSLQPSTKTRPTRSKSGTLRLLCFVSFSRSELTICKNSFQLLTSLITTEPQSQTLPYV